ncbi:MAG: protein phosphatase CheZ [Pseudomonadota bacterium]|nr:protein phosphatase CheZ [Pseudomonadota bacterium]
MPIDKSMNVLIVDDYKTMLRIIRNLLKQIEFHNVEEASDGSEALAKLRSGNIGLIISDWNMQPMTGLQLLHEVRADAKLKATPFIMVTAESKTENVVAAKQAGVSNYIVKPFNARPCATRSRRCWHMPESFTGTRAEPLRRLLKGIRERYPAGEPEWVADVVGAVLASLNGEISSVEVRLLREVEELGRTIANAKTEIAALRMDDITATDIPFATDELDAIVEHTASATDAILECCETLDQVAGALAGAPAASLRGATTRIYEACGFQDITGQRITKVVNTLKAIEAKVAQIVETFGVVTGAAPAGPKPDRRGGALMNGPQLPAAAMDQSDIDRLLASLD